MRNKDKEIEVKIIFPSKNQNQVNFHTNTIYSQTKKNLNIKSRALNGLPNHLLLNIIKSLIGKMQEEDLHNDAFS